MRVSVVEMSGQSSSVAALLAMMVVMMSMLITQTHCFSINQTITVSYSASCDGLNDDLSCLVGQTDLDSDEFMLDSEFSRRILQDVNAGIVYSTENADQIVFCSHKGQKNCHPPGNNNSKGDCKDPTNRSCYRYPGK